MKKKILTMGLALALAFNLTGCQNEKAVKGEAGQTLEEDIQEESQEKIIKASKEAPDLEGYTELTSLTANLRGPDSQDEIGLYIAAEWDEEAGLMLDDGQNWLLIVSNEDGHYLLFDDFIALGSLDLYEIMDPDQDKLVTEYSSTAGLTITSYAYDSESKSFKARVDFNLEGNVNRLTYN